MPSRLSGDAGSYFRVCVLVRLLRRGSSARRFGGWSQLGGGGGEFGTQKSKILCPKNSQINTFFCKISFFASMKSVRGGGGGALAECCQKCTVRRIGASYKASGPDASGAYDASYSVIQGVVRQRHRTTRYDTVRQGTTRYDTVRHHTTHTHTYTHANTHMYMYIHKYIYIYIYMSHKRRTTLYDASYSVVQGVGARRVGDVRRVGRCRGPTRRKMPTLTVVR